VVNCARHGEAARERIRITFPQLRRYVRMVGSLDL
jgi:hypothetical protein